jgi:hypothetical protein
VSARIDVHTGLLAPPSDTDTMDEWFFAEHLPATGNAANTPGNAGSEPLF